MLKSVIKPVQHINNSIDFRIDFPLDTLNPSQLITILESVTIAPILTVFNDDNTPDVKSNSFLTNLLF